MDSGLRLLRAVAVFRIPTMSAKLQGAFLRACMANNAQEVEQLLGQGVDIDKVYNQGKTALCFALALRNVDVV